MEGVLVHSKPSHPFAGSNHPTRCLLFQDSIKYVQMESPHALMSFESKAKVKQISDSNFKLKELLKEQIDLLSLVLSRSIGAGSGTCTVLFKKSKV